MSNSGAKNGTIEGFYMKLEEGMRQKGLVDGLAANQAVQLQRAFDAGFEEGARVGCATGRSLYAALREKKDVEAADSADLSQFHISRVLK